VALTNNVIFIFILFYEKANDKKIDNSLTKQRARGTKFSQATQKMNES